jgi:putative spermidine/putrescine transport system substrate-binding protein
MKKAVLVCLVLAMAASMVFAGGSSQPAAPAAGASAAPAAPAAKIGAGRTLVVGIWGAQQETIVREHIIKAFEAETGATVELVLGGSGDRAAKIYSELDNPSMDVVYLNMTQTAQATADGVILQPNPARVPEYNNLYPIAKSVGGYGVSLMAVGLMYNTDKFKTPPDSWTVMWDPANKGKVAPFPFPGTQGTAFLVMAAKINGGSESNIGPGFEAIAKLKPYPLLSDGIDEVNLAFKNGDVWLSPQMDGYANDYKEKGGPVGFVLPKEGAILSMNCAAVTKNSKNADLAEIWINYHLGQACQQAYAQDLKYGPTNSKITLPADLAAKVVYGDAAVSRLQRLDDATVTKNQSAWADRWNREILNK